MRVTAWVVLRATLFVFLLDTFSARWCIEPQMAAVPDSGSPGQVWHSNPGMPLSALLSDVACLTATVTLGEAGAVPPFCSIRHLIMARFSESYLHTLSSGSEPAAWTGSGSLCMRRPIDAAEESTSAPAAHATAHSTASGQRSRSWACVGI
ncbi:hypothetical protein K461DRAFT_117358 [Myriangium duriaei CBS 260.36]|uniref:Secreted protein n=1 Tax=Myriangium duriaei CBS 260.36 TaxID=1168546 RepID=A0A9P4J2C1_9PEZI|nr:hypothetical protein K461DRAFT_117358 [Myriangium duriaei CBS 260.36]